MNDTTASCFLFVGQSQTLADELQRLLEANRPLLLGSQNTKGPSSLRYLMATNQRQGLQLARQHAPQVIFLQVGKTNGDRLLFTHAIRQRLPIVKIIGIGSVPTAPPPDPPISTHHVDSFDGFLALPLHASTALLVLHKACRLDTAHLHHFGPFTLDVANDTLLTPTGTHHLRPKEAALLKLLLEQRNRVVTRAEIMLQIWETTFVGDTGTLDVHIRQLRKYIEVDPSMPQYLVTSRGQGYVLRV